MTKKLPLVILFTVLWLVTHAQQNPFNRFKLDFWDIKNGVPANSILGLYQSKDGFIWINGFFGLCRFDGISFKTFNSLNEPLMKTDAVVSPMTETNDSTLWIATNNDGLLAYKKGRFTAYMQTYSSLVLGGRSEKEELLFSTSNGRYPYVLFDTRSKKYTDINESMLQVLLLSGKIFLLGKADKDGNQWLLINNKIRRI
jgi:ligand-binding sensor domain-containing protein